MGREVKACGTVNCEMTLSINSKHNLCPRCRNYDKRIASQTPHWARHRHATLCRWDTLLVAAAPKSTFKNVEPIAELVPRKQNGTVTQIRKRA